MKSIRLLAAGLGLTLCAILIPAPPASATIHEIVAAWCSGHGELQPPGIQSGKNFAQPVRSNGFIGPTVPFRDGVLITFNFDRAPAKVIPIPDVFININTPEDPVYIQAIRPDPNFAAFMHCPKFAA